MHKKEKLTYKELEAKCEILATENKELKKAKKNKKKRLSNLGKFIISFFFVGKGLKDALKQGLDELSTSKKISNESIAAIGANIFWRLTRIGILGIIIAIVPSIFLYLQTKYLKVQNTKIDIQNNLIQNQNKRLDQQTYLQEANRRSSLVFLFSDVMDAINEELKDENANPDRNLSQQLIGRIVSLSKSLKPYRYLANDTLTPLISPERSQLLINLTNAKLGDVTYIDIFTKGDFSYSELKDYTFDNVPFGGINFKYSNFDNVKFNRCKFTGAMFTGVVADHVRFEYCDFYSFISRKASFEHLAFFNCNFSDRLIFDTSYAKKLLFEEDSFRILSIEDSLFDELTLRDSYATIFSYTFDKNKASAYFMKGIPENQNLFSKNTIKSKTLDTRIKPIGFLNTYFVEMLSDESFFSRLKENKGFYFNRYYFKKLKQKDFICNYLNVDQYALRYEIKPRASHFLLDTLKTPTKFLKFIEQNAIQKEHPYSYEKMVDNTRKLILNEIINRKTYPVEQRAPDAEIVETLAY